MFLVGGALAPGARSAPPEGVLPQVSELGRQLDQTVQTLTKQLGVPNLLGPAREAESVPVPAVVRPPSAAPAPASPQSAAPAPAETSPQRVAAQPEKNLRTVAPQKAGAGSKGRGSGRAARSPGRRAVDGRARNGTSRSVAARPPSAKGPGRGSGATPSPEPRRGRIARLVPGSIKLALLVLALVSTLLLLSTLISRRQLGQALRRAHHDALTGLPNRAAMDEALTRMVGTARRKGTPLGVVMVDLDHFKSVNDIYGHAMGDSVLALVGGVARSEVRAGDFVGRYGGEEFLLLMPDTDEPGARAVAEKLQLAFREVDVPDLGRRVTASFGVAAAAGSPAALAGLLRAADDALYRAKQNGRDRVELASETTFHPLEASA